LRAEATFAEQCPALSLDEIIDSVALDRLIVIAGEGATARTGPAVTGVPVTGLAPSTLVLAAPLTRSSPRATRLPTCASSSSAGPARRENWPPG
jgi:hypothetical protein